MLRAITVFKWGGMHKVARSLGLVFDRVKRLCVRMFEAIE
jgi:hypothetical protein